MIPLTHVLVLAWLQFLVGLVGMLLRREGMVVLVSALVMLNGVLMGFASALSLGKGGTQAEGMIMLLILTAVAVSGAAVLYSFQRFRKTVHVDDFHRMKN